MPKCCLLGMDIDVPKRRILKGGNFSLINALGPMGIEGYLLLCSNEHYNGFGSILVDDKLEDELEDLLSNFKSTSSLSMTFSRDFSA